MKIPTDVEIFGYRNVGIGPQERVTDIMKDENGLNYVAYRVQLDDESNRMLIIDLGHGRLIRIKLFSNKVQL